MDLVKQSVNVILRAFMQLSVCVCVHVHVLVKQSVSVLTAMSHAGDQSRGILR